MALRSWPYPSRHPAVLIHLSDRFVSNTRRRTQLAEITNHETYRPDLAVVTRTPIVRGVMQAMAPASPQLSAVAAPSR